MISRLINSYCLFQMIQSDISATIKRSMMDKCLITFMSRNITISYSMCHIYPLLLTALMNCMFSKFHFPCGHS